MPESTTHFGFKEIPIPEKARRVHEIFDSVAENYDLMNDLMSLGIHRLWKRYAIHKLRLKSGAKILDVAGGTGDLARLMRPKIEPEGQVIIYDINAHMLEVGRRQFIDRGILDGIEWLCGDAESLPFPDNTFHAVTIGFGIRNVTHIEKAFKEMVRVLRPGGQLLCLEFSHLTIPMLQSLYDTYSFNVLPNIGQWVANDREAYQYLVESIRRFPKQESLKAMLHGCGLFRVEYDNLSAGIAAVHTGYKV
ncbi:MAG: bifunctional demethylmenaquinone methyltransferase/2-methoxy-6-polyprenyl-1,4-benzoquinol methylase UbiE [Magnetococcus sp. DMHC-6]